MNLRQVFFVTFGLCCLAFETLALASLYQRAYLEQDGKTRLFSGNIDTWNNQGFSYHVYSRLAETLNVTASTLETASQRHFKYGEREAIFEVAENVNKALDNDTFLSIQYQHGILNPNTSSIHFFVWAENETHQFRINYVIGYTEQDYMIDKICVIFHSISMNSSTIYIRPWMTIVNLNLTRSALKMIKFGVRLVDYRWEEPNPLSIKVTVDLKKSYLLTYYDETILSTLYDYRIKLIQSGVFVCVTLLLMVLLGILFRKRLLS